MCLYKKEKERKKGTRLGFPPSTSLHPSRPPPLQLPSVSPFSLFSPPPSFFFSPCYHFPIQSLPHLHTYDSSSNFGLLSNPDASEQKQKKKIKYLNFSPCSNKPWDERRGCSMARSWESAPPPQYWPPWDTPASHLVSQVGRPIILAFIPATGLLFLCFLHAWKIHLKNPGTWPDMERMPERAKEALSHWKLIKDPEAEVSGQGSFSCPLIPASTRTCVDHPNASAAQIPDDRKLLCKPY